MARKCPAVENTVEMAVVLSADRTDLRKTISQCRRTSKMSLSSSRMSNS